MALLDSQLCIHTPGSHFVAYEALRNLPEPESMGSRHLPVPHWKLVDTIRDQVADRGWTVHKEKLGISQKGKRLFGTMQLRGPDTMDGMDTCFGFRSSTNQSFAIRGVAGSRIFVCDNLVLSGDEFVLNRKSTTLLNLPQMVSVALNKFIDQGKQLLLDIDLMKQNWIDNQTAKLRIFNLFHQGAMPLHLFDNVCGNYFSPQDEHVDCQPRTMWGLHNACTRAIKLLKPAAQFSASIDVGRQFHLATGDVKKLVTAH